MAKPKENTNYKVVAENRRARFDYAIEDDLEVGLVLEGSEVKSLREGSANIAESYAEVSDGELWLVNSYIAPYAQAKTFGHDERRRRKLLASKKELSRLWNETQRKGMTVVPLVLYFNHRGIAKMKVGIAEILKQEGFISAYEVEKSSPQSSLHIDLKYGPDGERVLRNIERVSKPGRRVYQSSKDLPPVLQGLGRETVAPLMQSKQLQVDWTGC